MNDGVKENPKAAGAWPNFIIIGAPKAGTTSAYHYLRQHPEVYMSPVKEPHYFAFEQDGKKKHPKSRMHGVTFTLEKYRALFADVTGEKAIGEASTGYLMSQDASERILKAIPDAKIIVILRNPAERAFSGYMMKLRNSREKSPVQNAFERGKVYVENSFYYENLMRYYDRFSREQIGVFLFEEFKENPVAVMRRMYRFIGVDDTFEPTTALQHNKAWMPKYLFLNDLRTFVLRSKKMRDLLSNTPVKSAFRQLTRAAPPSFPDEIRERLLDLYRPDIEKVQNLVEMDLSYWLDDTH